MTVERGYHTAALLADGRVLVLGGFADGGTAVATADIFDPKTGTFSPTGPMSLARARGPAATRLLDNRVVVTGGFNGKVLLATSEIYDPATGTFAATGPMAVGRIFQRATLLADGRVLVTGGGGHSGGLATAELFDPATGSFTATGPMSIARTGHTATRLADGRVLVVGGTSNQSGAPEGLLQPCVKSAEIYDPETMAFSSAGAMADARCGHAAVLLADGRVLVTGGGSVYGDPVSHASAEIYDPRTNTFSAVGVMAEARVGHTETLLRDGRVLIAGGNDAEFRPLASAEIYDPRTGTFRVTGSLMGRAWHTATLLDDGRVLLTGGNSAGWLYAGPFHASAEIYDPATGTFSAPGPGS
jgi:Kelch motif protein